MKEKYKLKNRIETLVQNKINAFSPTISPAPKSTERGEIESLYEGLKYYLHKGVNEFVIQKKYMGSYCDIYLMKEISNSYLVSRNGYKIKSLTQEKVNEICLPIYSMIDWTDKSMVLIQSEIMPWKAIGHNLIDNEYGAYLFSHKNHLSYLENNSLLYKIEKIKSSKAYIDILPDLQSMDDKALKKKYPSHIVRQYKSVYDFNALNLDTYKTGIELFEQQLDHFGSEGSIELKPFNILKIVYNDGTEDIPNDNLTFSKVSNDEYKHVTIRNEDELTEEVIPLYAWAKTLSDAMEEGIVIKPRTAFLPQVPPAFKVRNKAYLTLIYGLDFAAQYEKHIRRRNITEKLKSSINDWSLNHMMLKVPYKSIHNENYYFKNLIYDRIMQEEVETKLDTRL
jgi:hypothetical protein